ncbi:MAG: hypothetical protein FJ109_13825 [Deltaproteobacteria bacterium]|nr:hypothetical protein [Deltaproteobacteria bacterium]
MAEISFADGMKESQRRWLIANGHVPGWYEDRWPWVLTEQEKSRNLYRPEWWSFIQGREHRWARSLQSSQCFAVNIFAPLCLNGAVARTVLKELAPALGILDDDEVVVSFEATPDGTTNWLGESGRQPTQVDVLFEARRNGKPHGWLPVEVKFTETEPGSCRGARGQDKKGVGNPTPEKCMALPAILENPAAMCFMVVAEGRHYWDLMRSGPHPFDFSALADSPCPFRHGLYQIMRNHVLGMALVANRGGEWSRVGLCFHAGNEAVRQLPDSVGGLVDLVSAFDLMVPASHVVELDPASVVATVAARCPEWSEWAEWVAGRYSLESTDVPAVAPVPPRENSLPEVVETAVELIGERSHSFLADPPKPSGFWERLKQGFRDAVAVPAPLVSVAVAGKEFPSDYSDLGLEPFCRMHGYLLLLGFEKTRTTFALFWRGKLLHDIRWPDPAGKPLTDRVSLLAHLYSDAVEDDWRIDDDEAVVLHALARALMINESEAGLARRGVMFELMVRMLDDRQVADDEKARLARLMNALSITDSERRMAAQAAFLVAVGGLASGGTARSADLAATERLAADLGVDSEESRETLARIRTIAFANDLSEGRVPVVESPSVTLKRGEIAHLQVPVSVIQQKTKTVTRRGYIGTRVKIGGLPIYLGASQPFQTTSEVIMPVGNGQLVMTSQRIVLIGTKLDYSIKLDAVLHVGEFSNAIQLHHEGRYGGRIYKMDEPRRAFLLLKHLLQQSRP